MTREDNEIWKPAEYATYHKMVFRAMFNFLHEHFPPGTDPEWWLQYTKDLEATSEQVNGGPLVDGMLTAISDYIEDEYKKRREILGQAGN